MLDSQKEKNVKWIGGWKIYFGIKKEKKTKFNSLHCYLFKYL